MVRGTDENRKQQRLQGVEYSKNMYGAAYGGNRCGDAAVDIGVSAAGGFRA